jgi:hypothetical protein
MPAEAGTPLRSRSDAGSGTTNATMLLQARGTTGSVVQTALDGFAARAVMESAG